MAVGRVSHRAVGYVESFLEVARCRYRAGSQNEDMSAVGMLSQRLRAVS